MTSDTEQAAAPLLFNPFDPEFRANPYPTYQRLREEDPFHRSPLGFPVVSRYADCVTLLRHPRASSDSRNSTEFQKMTAEQLDSDQSVFVGARPFLFMDPPDHTRLRSLVSKAFTPRVVEQLRPRIQEIVTDRIDSVERSGAIEVIEQLAYPLPVIVISEMLGVPAGDHETFQAWSRELARSLDPDMALPPEVIQRREEAALEFAEYFRALIAKRRAEPRDDLLSALIAAEDEGQRLTEEELLETSILLLVAGHETTVNLIGNGMLALLRNPEQLEKLSQDASLARTAVEEVLRFDAPVQLTGRVALEDIELRDGTVQKGEQAVLLIAGANRDPEQFPGPDRLDIMREDNRHLAFGMGIHFCLGAPLARVEGQIALSEMARRLPDAQLSTDVPEYKENITLRGLRSLPVSFTPR